MRLRAARFTAGYRSSAGCLLPAVPVCGCCGLLRSRTAAHTVTPLGWVRYVRAFTTLPAVRLVLVTVATARTCLRFTGYLRFVYRFCTLRSCCGYRLPHFVPLRCYAVLPPHTLRVHGSATFWFRFTHGLPDRLYVYGYVLPGCGLFTVVTYAHTCGCYTVACRFTTTTYGLVCCLPFGCARLVTVYAVATVPVTGCTHTRLRLFAGLPAVTTVGYAILPTVYGYRSAIHIRAGSCVHGLHGYAVTVYAFTTAPGSLRLPHLVLFTFTTFALVRIRYTVYLYILVVRYVPFFGSQHVCHTTCGCSLRFLVYTRSARTHGCYAVTGWLHTVHTHTARLGCGYTTPWFCRFCRRTVTALHRLRGLWLRFSCATYGYSWLRFAFTHTPFGWLRVVAADWLHRSTLPRSTRLVTACTVRSARLDSVHAFCRCHLWFTRSTAGCRFVAFPPVYGSLRYTHVGSRGLDCVGCVTLLRSTVIRCCPRFTFTRLPVVVHARLRLPFAHALRLFYHGYHVTYTRFTVLTTRLPPALRYSCRCLGSAVVDSVYVATPFAHVCRTYTYRALHTLPFLHWTAFTLPVAFVRVLTTAPFRFTVRTLDRGYLSAAHCSWLRSLFTAHAGSAFTAFISFAAARSTRLRYAPYTTPVVYAFTRTTTRYRGFALQLRLRTYTFYRIVMVVTFTVLYTLHLPILRLIPIYILPHTCGCGCCGYARFVYRTPGCPRYHSLRALYRYTVYRLLQVLWIATCPTRFWLPAALLDYRLRGLPFAACIAVGYLRLCRTGCATGYAPFTVVTDRTPHHTTFTHVAHRWLRTRAVTPTPTTRGCVAFTPVHTRCYGYTFTAGSCLQPATVTADYPTAVTHGYADWFYTILPACLRLCIRARLPRFVHGYTTRCYLCTLPRYTPHGYLPFYPFTFARGCSAGYTLPFTTAPPRFMVPLQRWITLRSTFYAVGFCLLVHVTRCTTTGLVRTPAFCTATLPARSALVGLQLRDSTTLFTGYTYTVYGSRSPCGWFTFLTFVRFGYKLVRITAVLRLVCYAAVVPVYRCLPVCLVVGSHARLVGCLHWIRLLRSRLYRIYPLVWLVGLRLHHTVWLYHTAIFTTLPYARLRPYVTAHYAYRDAPAFTVGYRVLRLRFTVARPVTGCRSPVTHAVVTFYRTLLHRLVPVIPHAFWLRLVALHTRVAVYTGCRIWILGSVTLDCSSTSHTPPHRCRCRTFRFCGCGLRGSRHICGWLPLDHCLRLPFFHAVTVAAHTFTLRALVAVTHRITHCVYVLHTRCLRSTVVTARWLRLLRSTHAHTLPRHVYYSSRTAPARFVWFTLYLTTRLPYAHVLGYTVRTATATTRSGCLRSFTTRLPYHTFTCRRFYVHGYGSTFTRCAAVTAYVYGSRFYLVVLCRYVALHTTPSFLPLPGLPWLFLCRFASSLLRRFTLLLPPRSYVLPHLPFCLPAIYRLPVVPLPVILPVMRWVLVRSAGFWLPAVGFYLYYLRLPRSFCTLPDRRFVLPGCLWLRLFLPIQFCLQFLLLPAVPAVLPHRSLRVYVTPHGYAHTAAHCTSGLRMLRLRVTVCARCYLRFTVLRTRRARWLLVCAPLVPFAVVRPPFPPALLPP